MLPYGVDKRAPGYDSTKAEMCGRARERRRVRLEVPKVLDQMVQDARWDSECNPYERCDSCEEFRRNWEAANEIPPEWVERGFCNHPRVRSQAA